MDRNTNKSRFVSSVADLTITLIGYILMIYTDNNAVSGIIFVIPFLKETLETLTEKNTLNYILRRVNWVTLLVSIALGALYFLELKGICYKVTDYLLLIYPIKYVIYSVFYYNRY